MPITLDLPLPPSVNRLWRVRPGTTGKRMMRSKSYERWQEEADATVLVNKALRGHKKIEGPFEAKYTFGRPLDGRRHDLSNLVKATEDYLERIGIFSNDENCERFEVEWGLSGSGCRVTITEIAAS